MANFLDKLQEFFNKIFKKEKIYQLPTPNNTTHTENNRNFLNYKSSNDFVNPELELGIMQFLSSYYELADISDKTGIYPNAYDALIRINGSNESYAQKNIADKDNFTGLDGKKYNATSHSQMVSLALESSYMETVKEIARQDNQLGFLLSPDYSNDSKLFIQNLPYLDSNYHNYLINSMANKLEYLSYTNSITIRGIEPSKNQYGNQNLSQNTNEYYK